MITYFLLALVPLIACFVLTRRAVPTAINAVVGLVLAYWWEPTIGFWYIDLWFYVLLSIAGALAWATFFSDSFNNSRRYSYRSYDDDEKPKKKKFPISPLKGGVIVFFAMSLVLAVISWHSSVLWSGEEHARLVDVEEVTEFNPKDVFEGIDQARRVNAEMAKKAAREVLNSHGTLGSKVDIGQANVQTIRGEKWWIVSLEHKSLFKWNTNRTVPGYIKVSVRDYKDRELVTGKEIRYSMSGWFGYNISHRLYMNGFAGKRFMDYTYEVDDTDEGNFYMVVTVVEPQIGFFGDMPQSVVVINTETGEFKEYAPNEAPAWVDRVVPENIMRNRIDAWAKYQQGWLHTITDGSGVKTISDGTALTWAGSSGDGAYWYSGLQTASSGDESEATTGFVHCSTRTFKCKAYNRAGISESAAEKALDGLVSNYSGWKVATPMIPYTLPTGDIAFVATITSADLTPTRVGVISYKNRELKAVGNDVSLPSAIREFEKALRAAGADGEDVDLSKLVWVEGVVGNVNLVASDTGVEAYILIDGNASKGFRVAASKSEEVTFTATGHRVKLGVANLDGNVVKVHSFDNLDIEFAKE